LNESARLPGELSIDSGIVLAYYLGEKLGALVRTEIFEPEGKSLYHNRVCIAELFYVLCRRRGQKVAADYTRSYLSAGYSALADCYVIAVAKLQEASAVFARHETDLDREIKRKPFDVPILFMEDS